MQPLIDQGRTVISILHKYDYNPAALVLVPSLYSISILHKYDYNEWLSGWGMPLFNFNST